MVETAIYVLIGALGATLLALLALPAVSARAFRLSERRLRLTAPLSEAQAQAERDALRGRHAVEIARSERDAEAAERRWDEAQVALGRFAAELVKRDEAIGERETEIAKRDDEIEVRDAALADRATVISRLEAALAAAQAELADRTARLEESETAGRRLGERGAEREREIARLEAALATARTEGAASAARLEESETAGRRLSERGAEREREIAQLGAAIAAARTELDASAARLGESESQREHAELRLVETDEARRRIEAPPLAPQEAPAADGGGSRERELALRLTQLLAARGEWEGQMRALRADRDEAERRAGALEAGDALLRETLARLGRDLVAARPRALAATETETAG